MSRSSNLSRSDNMRAGRAYAPAAPFSDSLPGMFLSHLMVVRWGAGSKQGYPAPAVSAANNICTAQAIAGAVAAVLNGTLASGTPAVATLDVARNLQMVSTNAGDTTQTATIIGTDIVGRLTTERVSLNGTTIVASLRAYKTIRSITLSAALAGNLTVGTNTALGVPVRIRTGDILLFKANNAVPEAGTIVAGVTTTPSLTTGDPLGTIIPTTAANGTNIYTALINVEDSTENAYGSVFNV